MMIRELIPSLDREALTGAPFLRVAEQRPPALPGAARLEDDTASTVSEARRQILVVDDEDLFREGLVFKLRNLYSVAVDEAETGLIAIEKASTGRGFDLILMDVSLPDIGGEQAYEAMRARGVDALIVLMSAYEEYRGVAQALGVPFLDKPLDDAALEKLLLECGGVEGS